MKYLIRWAICCAVGLWFYHMAESSASVAIGLLAFLVFFNGWEMEIKLKEVRKALGMHTKRFLRDLLD